MTKPIFNAEERYYSTREVMAMLNISQTTVYRLVETGKLDKVRFGRSVRFAHSAIQRCFELSTEKHA